MTADPVVRPASTVVILRDSSSGPEVFLVRRHQAIAFMAGAHVFPGGRVDETDRAADESWCDGVDDAASKIPGVAAEDAVAFQVAAARELFEEAGVLLARHPAGEFVALASAEAQQRFAAHRVELNASRETLKDIVTSEGLRLALDTFVHYAHWVTPPIDVKRFDTRFFISRLPSLQTPMHDDHEATESVWMTPTQALAAAKAHAVVLPPPTWATLRELERFTSVAEAIGWARSRPVYRREPRVTLDTAGVRHIVLPGDPELPEPEPVAFETRFVLANGQWTPEAHA